MRADTTRVRVSIKPQLERRALPKKELKHCSQSLHLENLAMNLTYCHFVKEGDWRVQEKATPQCGSKNCILFCLQGLGYPYLEQK